MSQNFENKKILVGEIIEKAKAAKSLVLVDYKGLTVAQSGELRGLCRKNEVEFHVYKNRLLKRAFETLGIAMPAEVLEGQTAIAFGKDDLSAASILSKFAEANKMQIKSGYGFSKVLTEAEVKALASIPSKEVLYAQLVGMLSMPLRSLAVTIAEIAKKKA